MRQRTIAEKISCTGIGLHTGKPVQLTLHPAHAGSGIVFVRTDGLHPVEIPARPESLSRTLLATTLGRGDVTIDTVEHLLAALYALGIDNVRVEVDGPEVPGMDGSAASFVFLIRAAGIYEQRAPRRMLRVRRPVEVHEGTRWIRVEPARSLRVSYEVEFDHPVIRRQRVRNLEICDELFEREIARARTFGFVQQVEALWASGRARGASLDNTVVLDERGVLNRDGLRYEDEFVRHKALDLLGDLALIGMPLLGHVRVARGGHELHQRLVAKLLATPQAQHVEATPYLPGADFDPVRVAAAVGLVKA
ncbi:MAG: UDP-3-O-acyl-N-acetylglucosamine deacetylase [Myxococcota bacterium]|nr:UDP-3-O-acyl-N-acetylglucosamine deacetylase [Myxococcota bacterium]